MPENQGVYIELTAEDKNFSQAMMQAYGRLKELANETNRLKAENAALNTNIASLTRQIGTQKEKLEQARQKLEQLTAAGKENSKATQTQKDKILSLENSIQKANTRLEKYTAEQKQNAEAQTRLAAETEKTTREINSQTQAFAKNAKQGTNTASQLKSAFTMLKGLALGYAGKTLFNALIGSNTDFEQSMTSFEVLLGSAEKAQTMMDNLSDFAAKTPLEMEDVTKATNMLLGYGVAAEDVLDIMGRLGDLSQGNAERLDRISLAYGQMLAKGKVTGEELRQMVEAQVPLLQGLADYMNVSTAELQDMISDGVVGINELNGAIKAMTDEGGAFYGMMEKQAQTMGGMWSTLKDEASIFAREVGEESFGYLKTELNDLMLTIEQMEESGELDAIAADIGEDIANAVKTVANLVKMLYEMKDAILAATVGVATYKASFSLLTTGVSAFNAVKETFNIITGKSVVVKNLETGATATLTAAEAASVTAKNSSIVAQTKLNAVMGANPVMAVVSGVVALTSALVAYAAVTEDAEGSTRALIKELNEMADAYENAKKSAEDSTASELAKLEVVSDTIPRLEELANKTNRTAEEEWELKDIIDGLNEAMPNLKLAIDDETGALNMQTEAVWGAVGAYQALAEAKALQNLAVEAETNRIKAQKTYDDNITKWDEATKEFPGYGWVHYSERVAYAEAADAKEKTSAEIEKWTSESNYYKGKYEDLYRRYRDDLAKVEALRSARPGGNTSSGSNTSSGGSRSSTKSSKSKRKDEIAEEMRLDELWNKQQLEWGNITEKEFAQNLSNRADAYRRYADEIMSATDMTETERLELRQEYIEKAEALELEYYNKLKSFAAEEVKNDADTWKEKLQQSKDWIEERDFYGDWEEYGDSRAEALERYHAKVEDSYNQQKWLVNEYFSQGLMGAEEYYLKMEELHDDYRSNINAVNRDIFTEGKKQIQQVLEEAQETLKKGYELDMLFDTSVAYGKYREEITEFEAYIAELEGKNDRLTQEYERRNRELDEMLKAFERGLEDEDDEVARERLQYFYEYEHDEDNLRALKKQIDEFDREMEEKMFRRGIEDEKDALAEEKERLSEYYGAEIEYAQEAIERKERLEQEAIDRVNAYYEKVMSAENLMNEMYSYLTDNQGIAEGIGELMGRQMMEGLDKQFQGWLAGAIEAFEESGLKYGTKKGSGSANSIVNNNNKTIQFNQTVNGLGDVAKTMAREAEKVINKWEMEAYY